VKRVHARVRQSRPRFRALARASRAPRHFSRRPAGQSHSRFARACARRASRARRGRRIGDRAHLNATVAHLCARFTAVMSIARVCGRARSRSIARAVARRRLDKTVAPFELSWGSIGINIG